MAGCPRKGACHDQEADWWGSWCSTSSSDSPLFTLALLHSLDGETQAAPGSACTAPDNGSGTVDLPADCDYIALEEPMKIIDGLPSGTTIELDPTFDTYDRTGERTWCTISLASGVCEGAGSDLGGTGSCAEANLDLTVSGTGELEGFNRHLVVPMLLEAHSAPRTPGDPVQTFETDMYRLRGELFGDPDFCEFIVTAGTANGLSSPGETTLTELSNGDYAVDSFFDITYQIEFEGCPGSQIEDYSGTTTGTIRLEIPEDAIEWSELLYPTGHPMDGESIDLAFAIRSEDRCTAGADTDGDTFKDEVEYYLGADCLDDCPDTLYVHDAWPLDMNMDRLINLGYDVSRYVGNIGCEVAITPACQRLDLNMDGLINLGYDVSKYVGHIGDECT